MEIERIADLKHNKSNFSIGGDEDDAAVNQSDAANWGVTYVRNGISEDTSGENKKAG